jgi:hypothetical protein
MKTPEIEAFREECVAFFDASVPARRSGARAGACADFDPIVLFRETDPAHEQMEVVAARAFREKLHSANLAWISGPTKFGGRDLPPRYEAVPAAALRGRLCTGGRGVRDPRSDLLRGGAHDGSTDASDACR